MTALVYLMATLSTDVLVYVATTYVVQHSYELEIPIGADVM